MKALSIMQPWASLIVGGPLAPGPKRTENRGRALAMVAHRLIGKRIAIHASKRHDAAAFEELFESVECDDGSWFGVHQAELPYRAAREFPLGAVIGVATIGRVFGPGAELTDDEARFYIGNDLLADDTWGIRFDDARWFAPIECKGALGFWPLPDDVEARVREQLA